MNTKKRILAGVRATEEANDLEPLKIQGLILRQAFFGGTQRTESELRPESNPFTPLCVAVTDLMWELALPIDANRDHEYCNFRTGKGVEKLDKMRELGWRVLVSGNGGDPLVDREKELAQLMEEKGLHVVKDFEEEGFHGIELVDPSKSIKLIAMANQPIDPYHHLDLVLNPNGTLTRLRHIPNTPPSSDSTLPVLTKDLTINQPNNTWLRLFLPRIALSSNQKLPLIFFFHGSGFVVASAASTMFHDFCADMSSTVGAVVASVEYRLAPEHRLPAAYDDAAEALAFIRSSRDEWLTKYADFGNCYLMGNSAGGTIAYFAGLRAIDCDIEPLRIKGLILRQPFFGGTQRSGSELRLENDEVIPLSVSDLLWELSLPVGVDRDHEYSNLRAENWVGKLEKVRELEWRVLVSGNGGDPLVDREKELVEVLEEKGVQVVTDFEEEGCHGVEYSDASKAKRLIQLVKHFVSSLDAY
ncbi:Carboxylesterase 1, partial [Mucuna pruriens]